MDKNATSGMHERSWSGKPRKLGPEARSRPYDPSATLSDPRFVQQALLQALREGDFQAVMEIYRAHLRVLNRSHIAKALNISRQSVHKMLKPSGAPSLKTFAAFMKILRTRTAESSSE